MQLKVHILSQSWFPFKPVFACASVQSEPFSDDRLAKLSCQQPFSRESQLRGQSGLLSSSVWSLSLLLFVCLFAAKSLSMGQNLHEIHFVPQAGFQFTIILLPHPPKCQDYRCEFVYEVK